MRFKSWKNYRIGGIS